MIVASTSIVIAAFTPRVVAAQARPTAVAAGAATPADLRAWDHDYLFKRFGRHGIDDRELRMAVFTHPVRQEDIGAASLDVRGTFYLAIEGGRNATSGQTVQGVGASNRDQIEKAFFRALTVLLPSSATFGLVRVATIQAARDLYGAGSAAERAIAQAWDAVGVQERTVPTAAMLPNPAQVFTGACGQLASPHWVVGITLSAGTSNLRVAQWTWDFFDHTGALQDREQLTSTQFAQSFSQCGPGSDRVLAQNDACSGFCVDLRGDRSGSTQITFTATDDAGRAVTFSTPRVTLSPPQ